MFAASWFRFPKLHFAAAPRKKPRRPLRSPLFLESLEERAVPSATSNGLLGGVNSATFFNGFNTAQSGFNLAPNPAQLNGLAVGIFPNEGTPNSVGPALGSMAAPLAQDHLGAQFRMLGVNSQGQNGQLNLGVPNSIFFDSFGFGSGAQPNQPWVPNAYNLGLANGQWAFPTMADFGSFRGTSARYPGVSHLRHPSHEGEHSQPLLPPRDALASAEIDELAKDRIDEEVAAKYQPIPIFPLDEGAEDGEVVPSLNRENDTGDRARPEPRFAFPDAGAETRELPVENAYFTEGYSTRENAFPFEESHQQQDAPAFLDGDLVHELPPLESLNLPSSFLLTVLTPAQLMVLLAEFPLADNPLECEEVPAETAEPE